MFPLGGVQNTRIICLLLNWGRVRPLATGHPESVCDWPMYSPLGPPIICRTKRFVLSYSRNLDGACWRARKSINWADILSAPKTMRPGGVTRGLMSPWFTDWLSDPSATCIHVCACRCRRRFARPCIAMPPEIAHVGRHDIHIRRWKKSGISFYLFCPQG